MSRNQARFNFSIIRLDGYYRIQCDNTLELVSGKVDSLKKARTYLRDHVNTSNFQETLKNMSLEEVKRRMKLFGGRLRTRQKPWTLEEARLVASTYDSRGQFYNENQKAYLAAYQKGWLNEICAHMRPSQKKNKFVYGMLNPNTALAKIFDYNSHREFTLDNQSAYDALRRFGVDTVELFDNRDNAEHLKMVIRQLAGQTVEKCVGAETDV